MLKTLATILLPPLCERCCCLVATPNSLCRTCWQEMTFITAPSCPRCAQPVSYRGAGECSCPAMPFAGGRAALVYNEASKGLLLTFKHSDGGERRRLLAGLLWQAAAPQLRQCDVLLPVPLHWRRRWQRRYNQAALLTQHLSDLSGKPWLPDTLRRVRATGSQQGRSSQQRRDELRGAFAVHQPERISSRVIALVDDVWTTGATFAECARTLRQAGAKEVYVFAVARAVKTDREQWIAVA